MKKKVLRCCLKTGSDDDDDIRIYIIQSSKLHIDYLSDQQKRNISKCHAYIPSFSNVEAFGLLRLLTNISSLNDDGIVPLQLQVYMNVIQPLTTS